MKEIARKRAYNGHIFDVDQVQVRLQDDQQKQYELVVHPGAVVIVPFVDGQIWFVRQFRLGSNSLLLELPAGRLEAGEQPEICARREIREETGLRAEEWLSLGGFYNAPGYCTEFLHIFLASNFQPDPLLPDQDEFIEIVKMPVDEVFALAERGEIHDGKTLAALLLARPYLK